MVLRNAYKTGTMFLNEGDASKAMDTLMLRYRTEAYFLVEVEYEEKSEKASQ